MPRMHIDHDHESSDQVPTLRFPVETVRNAKPAHSHDQPDRELGTEDATEDVLVALENVSRRIDDLAKELNCLGWFDNDDDRPRAA